MMRTAAILLAMTSMGVLLAPSSPIATPSAGAAHVVPSRFWYRAASCSFRATRHPFCQTSARPCACATAAARALWLRAVALVRRIRRILSFANLWGAVFRASLFAF
jgi:hypothetical protein